MDIVLSGNALFCKWLGLDLPRVKAADGKGIGVQKLVTGLARMCWQCHAIKPKGVDAGIRDVIVVEAYSRYTLILPNMEPMTQDEFQDVLLKRWGNELMEVLLQYNVITEGEIESMVLNFQKTDFKFHWIQNTDMSVGGHVSDAEMWLRSEKDNYDHHQSISDERAFALGMHINNIRKKVSLTKKPKRFDRFYPIERFLNDFMLRFSDREFGCPYPLVYLGEFPSPYQYAQSKAETIQKNKHKADKVKSRGFDNIISLDLARLRKNK